MNWTKKQELAFSLRNRELLISAAAGSGKTAVMVERLIKMITDESRPIDIDHVLVVTFTRAAAESMKSKIRTALEEKISKDYKNVNLQKQIMLLNHANISTIDSFCSYVIKNYFYLVDGVTPQFRIADEGEIKMLQSDVMEELLEKEYSEESDDFIEFVNYFASGKNDKPIEDLIIKMYLYSVSHPDPDRWLDECTNIYRIEDFPSKEFDQYFSRHVRFCISRAVSLIERAIIICEQPDGPYMYLDMLNSDLEKFELFDKKISFQQVHSMLITFKFDVLSRKKDPVVNDELRSKAKEYRDAAKKIINDLKQDIAYSSIEYVVGDINKCVFPANELVRLTKKFTIMLDEKKRKRGLLDYSDLEHIALKILSDRDGERSSASMQLERIFDEIMIDEYQDSNMLQESILYSIAGIKQDYSKVFMVGDIKQSIYRFRMACPELFINKLESFDESDSKKQKIFLQENFRSRRQVIDSVNHIFSNLMKKSISSIEYNDEQKLKYAADYSPECSDEYQTEVLHMERPESEVMKFSMDDVCESEASIIGEKIKSLVDATKGLMIRDPDTGDMRKALFGDIVILTRNQKGVTDIIINVLKDKFGIPVKAVSQINFLETYEVKVVMNYLNILDNPHQDVPLTAVLFSPIVGLDTHELAKIRIIDKGISFYNAVIRYFNDSNSDDSVKKKLDAFFEIYNKIRKWISVLSMHELIWKIYDMTGIYSYVSGMPAGSIRRDNLDQLLKKAVSFESTSYKGLFHFLRYIERIKKYEIELNDGKLVGDDNSVKIMTIHKSKGLEFPIVFLAGLNKLINTKDETGQIVLHQNMGIGLETVDTVKRTHNSSIIKSIISNRLHIDNYGEEIRVLYVAMTRAMEKLIIVSCHKESDIIDEFANGINENEILKSKTYWGWLRNLFDKNFFDIKEYKYSDLIDIDKNADKENEKKSKINTMFNDFNINKLEERLSFSYISTGCNNLNKLTVSDIKKDVLGEEVVNEANWLNDKQTELIPRFLRKTEKVSASRRGQLYHLVFEKLDFLSTGDYKSVNSFLNNLLDRKLITNEEFLVIDPDKILSFLSTNIGKRMKIASINGSLKREQPFTVLANKKDLGLDEIAGDNFMMQGIIDAYFIENNKIVLIDYKTDFVNNLNELEKKYSMQLYCYKYAIEKLTGYEVSELWIYSVHKDIELRLKPY